MHKHGNGLIGTPGFCVTGLLVLLLLSANSCQSKKEAKEEVPIRDINAVMNSHTTELMAISGVVGVAVGETENKTPCILVLVVEETAEIKRNVPRVLEGHPVRLLVTGEIKPMKSD